MAVQITIVGLGQIGASFGLALANQPELVRRVGHDRQPEIGRKAEKMGALDKLMLNLPAAVQDADLVLLSVPIDQLRDTLAVIAPVLKEGSVVMDTAPVKEVVAAWAAELLPADRHYVGLTPVINPLYLDEPVSGLEAARADLFKGGLIAIVAPPRTHSEAIKLAADLARLVGSSPFFVDPLEIDGLMAATHLLPQLLAAGLINSTADQPGWREGRKVAGRAYAEATGPIVRLGDAKALKSSVLLNRENTLRVIDSAIAALQIIRSDIDAQDGEALLARLERARSNREKWWKERQIGDWTEGEGQSTEEIPDVLGRLFGVRRKPKK
jgi:prephenate dehydrogenase